ncbi:MAG: Os1348 family NHLP clan protein [Chloroflexota bacterium]|jgi:hypothetical protein
MSDKSISEIIEKATNDATFRQQLLNNPLDTLKGFDLTDEERDLLSGLDEDTFDEFAGGLGDRSTKGSMRPGFG